MRGDDRPAGTVTGARFGAGDLPDRWLDTVDLAGELRELAADIDWRTR